MLNRCMVLKKPIIYKIITYVLILIISFIFFCALGNDKRKQAVKKDVKKHNMIYGLTIDDAWYDTTELEDVLQGLKYLKIKPTVRIVMSKEIEPSEYIKLFKSIKAYAYIMACPVDSFEMKNFKDQKSYLQRFKDSYKHLSPYVSIWEVGNEINGTEWIDQKPELIIDKISSASNFIKSKGGKISLTLYCTDSPQKDMIDWTKKYVPKEIADSVDYCFVSYYEDDNNAYVPQWKSIFKNLGEIFPSASLGIGECGNIAKNASEKSKIEMAEKYYSMPKYHKRFVGGYFWWNWVEDCIPHQNNKVYETIRKYGQLND